MKTALLASLLSVALTACGGGGGSSPAPVAAPITPVIHTKTHVTIDVRGDSTEWGVCTALATGRCTPTPAMLMQTDLDAALGVGVVTVRDESAPGSTLQQDLTGTGAFGVSTPAQVAYGTGLPLATLLAGADNDADIVITNSEINDQFVAGLTPAQFLTNVQSWIQTVQQAGKVAIYLEPNPVAPTAIANPTYNATFIDGRPWVASINTGAASLGVTVAPLYTAFIQSINWNVLLIGPDGVHPNAAGYAFKEAQYLPTVLAAVKKLMGT